MDVSEPKILVLSSNGTIHAMRARDGVEVWHHAIGSRSPGIALTAARGTAYAVMEGRVRALRIADGAPLWETPLADPEDGSTLDVRSDSVRIAAGDDVIVVGYTTRLASGLQAFDAHSGYLLWRDHQIAWHERIRVRSLIPPLLTVGDDLTYMTEHLVVGRGCITRALRLRDGGEQWRTQHAIWPNYDALGSPPALVVADTLYGYGAGNSRLLALDAYSGLVLWQQIAASDGGSVYLSVGGGALYLATAHSFCAYELHNGSHRWCLDAVEHDSGFESFGSTAFSDGTTYVGRSHFNPNTFQIEALDSRTGRRQWTWPEAGTQWLNPDHSWRFLAAFGMVYVPSEDGLYAISGADGRLMWTVSLDACLCPIVAAA
jgi:outer membrane protein assembly factor BamB